MKLDDELYAAATTYEVSINQRKSFCSVVRQCDLAITDIHHDIEFSSLSAVEMTKDVVLLREYLRKRREYKEKIELIDAAKTFKADNITKCVQRQQRRQYTPRILKGLKIGTAGK